jgi:hypothetical protein
MMRSAFFTLPRPGAGPKARGGTSEGQPEGRQASTTT